MLKTTSLSPNSHPVAGVVATCTLGVYLVGQATEWLHEGHVLPETHSERFVTPMDSTATVQVNSGVAGRGAALWNDGRWNHGLWS